MDEIVDSLLHLVHFLLRIDEGFGDGIAQKGIALGLESGDFAAIEGKTLVLLLVQGPAFFGQTLILLLRLGVRHEGIDPLADVLELRLLDDSLAKLQSFLSHRLFDLRNGLHGSQHASILGKAQEIPASIPLAAQRSWTPGPETHNSKSNNT